MNEKEREKIKEIKDKLKEKKQLTEYDKGQLDLIEVLRKKEPKTKFEKYGRCFLLILTVSTMILLMYGLVNVLINRYPLERAVKKWINEDEDLCTTKVIDDNKGIGFINYDCKPINRITKGIKRCKGQYYVFVNKIEDSWVVNESSQTVIW